MPVPIVGVDWAVVLRDSAGAFFGTGSNPITTTVGAASGTQNVQGVQAAGAAITENPVLIAGQNAGNVKLMSLSSGGAILLQGTLSNNNAAPGADFIEGLTSVANAASPSWTEGNMAALSSDLAGRLRVRGTMGNNAGAPGTDNQGFLGAIANAAAPSWTEGRQVLQSVDLAGNQRSIIMSALPTGANTIGAVTQASGPWTVQGAGADNAALSGNPLRLGVSDATNLQTWRQIGAATGTTGAGLAGVGPALWDLVGTTNYVKQAGDGSGRAMVVGAAAAGATLAGNPLLLGVSDGTNAQTIKQIGSVGSVSWVGTPGVALMLTAGGTNVQPAQNAGAAVDANSGGQQLIAAGSTFNGSNFDRMRNNVDVQDFSAASRTTTQTSADINLYNAHSLMVALVVTTNAGNAGSITLTINWKEPGSNTYNLLLSGAAVVTANVTNIYSINPNIPAVANVSAQKDCGRIVQIVVTHNNANPVTWSCGHTAVS